MQAKKYMASKVQEAYLRKRFRRAAAIRAWSKGASVLAALGVLLLIPGSPFLTWIRGGYVLIAIAYFWTEVHYGAKHLELRFARRFGLQPLTAVQRKN